MPKMLGARYLAELLVGYGVKAMKPTRVRGNLVAARAIGDLDVSDPVKVAAEDCRHILVLAPGVVNVKLQIGVRVADLLDHFEDLGTGVQGESGGVVVVDRFHHEPDALAAEGRRRVPDIFRHGIPGFSGGEIRVFQADQAVQSADAKEFRRGNAPFNPFPEFLFALRVARCSTVSSGPVAGGEVAQDELQSRFFQLGLDVVQVIVVREHELYGMKTRSARRRKPFHEGNFRKEKCQIRCKVWHTFPPVRLPF